MRSSFTIILKIEIKVWDSLACEYMTHVRVTMTLLNTINGGLSCCPIAFTQATLGHMVVGHMWGPFFFVTDSNVLYMLNGPSLSSNLTL